MKEKILSASSPLSVPVNLYKNTWDGGSLDETLSIVGGLHGNQLNGFYITARLSQFLQSIKEGTQKGYHLRGKVQIFPVVNTLATQAGSRNWPFDALDMDLAFPGNESGEIGERLGNTILEHTIDSTFGIILSTAANHYEDSPHITVPNPNRSLKKTTRFLGLEAAREISNLPKTHLLCHWVEHDVPSLMITGGKANDLDKNCCEKIFKGIVNLMLAFRLLSHSRQKPEQIKTTLYTSKNEITLATTQAGLFIPEVHAGDLLSPGQRVGIILDIFTGKTVEEIIASTEGFLITLRDYPLVYEKEMIAVILTKKGPHKLWPF